jgi:hypothetical protein
VLFALRGGVERELLFETDTHEHFVILLFESLMVSQKFFVRFVQTLNFRLALEISLNKSTDVQQRRVRIVGHNAVAKIEA